MIAGTNCKVSGELRISPDEIDNAADKQLIELARSDAAAFSKLYRRHYDTIFRYCAHRLFDRHIAEDVNPAFFAVLDGGQESKNEKWGNADRNAEFSFGDFKFAFVSPVLNSTTSSGI